MDTEVLDVFQGFASELRKAEIKVGSGELINFVEGIALLDPTEISNIYYCGRATLVNKKEQLPIYNRVFQEYFLNLEKSAVVERRKKMSAVNSAQAQFDIPDNEGEGNSESSSELKLGINASGAEIYREKNFRECSPEELARIRKVINLLASRPPMKRSRRIVMSKRGSRLHIRKMVRESAQKYGEIDSLRFTQEKQKIRPIVFLLDVSGSMADYSRAQLQLAYALQKSHQKVEVFCFGTRLSRITALLAKRSPDVAMELAGKEVLDWDGGTNIGKSIKEMLKRWGRKGLTRKAIVIICSDGLDRGSPKDLHEAMESLARTSHSIIWVNPNMIYEESANTMALMVAQPYIDQFFSGANLQSMERLVHHLRGLTH